jgi:DNA recombination protein RmuC
VDVAVALAILAAGFALGATTAWLLLRGSARAAAGEAAAAAREEATVRVQQRLLEEAAARASLETRVEEQRRALEGERALLADAERRLADTFKALSADALRASSDSFLQLARQSLEAQQEGARGDLELRQQAIGALVAPVRDALARFEERVGDLERRREGAYAGLTAQVRSLGEAQSVLRTEAANLVRALRAPQVRGRWGEVQLRRVVELAGMTEHVDFTEQHVVPGSGGGLRPDLVVHLPGGRTVVVDAKAPLSAYLEAVEATDEAARTAHLVDHARQVRDHVVALSRKAYWDELRPTPEFVVLFLPGESFFAAALEQDPELIERGAQQRVILATPTTLVALLKAVSFGWKQEAVAENAVEVARLGRELHKRIGDMAGHVAKVGRQLGGAVEAYNAFVGSLESRVLPAARRFRELEASGAEGPVPDLATVDASPRRPLVSSEPGEVPAAAPAGPDDGGDPGTATGGARG